MTMSHDAFVARLRQIGDEELPASRGSTATLDAVPRPVNHAERRAAVGRRITARKRLRVASALASVLVVALAVVGAVAVRHSNSSVEPAAAPLPAPAAEFTAADGVVYRKIGSVSIDTAKTGSVSVTVPAGTEPISIYATCALADPHSREDSAMSLETAPSYQGYGGVFSCRGSHPAVQEFSRSELTGRTLRFATAATLADAPTNAHARWLFSVYTWVVPKALRPAPAAPVMPATITLNGQPYTLTTKAIGSWPQQRSAQLTVPAGTKPWVLAVACTSAIAGKPIYVDPADQADTNLVTCADVAHGIGFNATTDIHGPSASATTVTFHFSFDPIYLMRGGSWTVGIYKSS